MTTGQDGILSRHVPHAVAGSGAGCRRQFFYIDMNDASDDLSHKCNWCGTVVRGKRKGWNSYHATERLGPTTELRFDGDVCPREECRSAASQVHPVKPALNCVLTVMFAPAKNAGSAASQVHPVKPALVTEKPADWRHLPIFWSSRPVRSFCRHSGRSRLAHAACGWNGFYRRPVLVCDHLQ